MLSHQRREALRRRDIKVQRHFVIFRSADWTVCCHHTKHTHIPPPPTGYSPPLAAEGGKASILISPNGSISIFENCVKIAISCVSCKQKQTNKKNREKISQQDLIKQVKVISFIFLYFFNPRLNSRGLKQTIIEEFPGKYKTMFHPLKRLLGFALLLKLALL